MTRDPDPGTPEQKTRNRVVRDATFHDPTENMRRILADQINARAAEREALAAKHGAVWDTAEMQAEFDVLGFAAPFVVVARKADGVRGTLEFQHYPRYYFNFVAD